ncbi:MAG: class I SAM-dependent methyltransferase [Proteobacteria bacterium]|nr:class I SAM-dependent methyltransferase [Pseudomonadota bacterium]
MIDRILFPILIGLARITLLKNRMALRQENGKPVAIGVQGEPEFVVTILSAVRLLRRLGNAELASGESYMDGAWRLEKGDLGAFLGYLLQCRQHLNQSPLLRLYISCRDRFWPPHRRNNPKRSRQNAAHHYNIGNDLYEKFLDDGMNYSCAFFGNPKQSLADAQGNKILTSIERLDIKPDMHVLDCPSSYKLEQLPS